MQCGLHGDSVGFNDRSNDRFAWKWAVQREVFKVKVYHGHSDGEDDKAWDLALPQGMSTCSMCLWDVTSVGSRLCL